MDHPPPQLTPNLSVRSTPSYIGTVDAIQASHAQITYFSSIVVPAEIVWLKSVTIHLLVNPHQSAVLEPSFRVNINLEICVLVRGV